MTQQTTKVPDRPAVSAEPHEPAGFRPDIQALRAVAVGLVLLYHLFPTRVTGGFVGVDVFFVISGFLIVGNLERDVERSGTIRLGRFWSRRARRLAPASLLVLAASTVATVVWVPQNLWSSFFDETIASTFYVQNWLLAHNSVDYLAASNAASPSQHFWTLSVEEQFYVVTPLLLVGLLLAARRFSVHHRTLFVAVIGTITVSSFVYSVWLTATSAPSAYFATTTRAWEFGAGALLVFVRSAPRVRLATPAFLVGALGLVLCALLLSGSDPFPGWLAATVVVSSVLVLWSGATVAAPLARVLASRVVQFVGTASYSIYLWHWPLIILVPYATGHALTLRDKVAVAVATLVLGWASTRFVEDPVRYSPRLLGGSRRPRTILLWTAAAMAVVCGLVAGGTVVKNQREQDTRERIAAAIDDHRDCLGALALDAPERCDGAIPADVLTPDPALAADDDGNDPACWSGLDDPSLNLCTLGPADADVRIAVLGDSHSNGLLEAYRSIAEKKGWRIDVAGHGGCYWTAAVQPKLEESQVGTCEAWKSSVEEHLADSPQYTAIVVTNSRTRYTPKAVGARSSDQVAADGLVEAWADEAARGTTIIALRDNPTMRADVVTCVTRWAERSNDHCAQRRSRALGSFEPLLVAASRTPGARVIDLSDTYCTPTRCLPIIGNVVVYRDFDHLTGTFVKTLTPRLEAQLTRALGSAADAG